MSALRRRSLAVAVRAGNGGRRCEEELGVRIEVRKVGWGVRPRGRRAVVRVWREGGVDIFGGP